MDETYNLRIVVLARGKRVVVVVVVSGEVLVVTTVK